MTESTVAEVEPDLTTFTNRYPEPTEILKHGGLAGVEYCYVAGHNQRKYSDIKDDKGFGWSPINGVPVLTFAGPLGTVDTVIVMGKGEPILGADDNNGIRQWYVDVDIEESIGVPANPQSPVAELLKE